MDPSGPLAPVGTVSIDIAQAFDGQYVGILLATILSGITIVQGWIYLNDNKDNWMLRSLVYVLIIADIITTVIDLRVLHRYLIENFGDLGALVIAHSDVISEYTITVLIVFLVHIFFVTRIYLLHKEQWWAPSAVAFFALVALVTGLVAIADLANHPQVSYLVSKKSKIMFGINGGFSAIADITITYFLTWSFSNAKRGINSTDTILQKLLVYVVSRGLLVTVTQVLFLITYVVKPTALWWVPLHFMASKLYVISMVTMLNGRGYIRQQIGTVHTQTSMFANSNPNPPRVLVQKTIELSQFADDEFNPDYAGSNGQKGGQIQEYRADSTQLYSTHVN
ncbi:hypothetical protein BJ138DRAFT_354342 [Hygrophoropsis aurantiaca]|uniref:Uncharacterized protein n=1 Tax=Hygrophoropsis aurantiaca TaxID=72124 RepID=A0ACB8A5F5_9AGAM|nr:hypothetical protein BJ138DRAFT_354342 [Hygrophoropsis aurantiaca]